MENAMCQGDKVKYKFSLIQDPDTQEKTIDCSKCLLLEQKFGTFGF